MMRWQTWFLLGLLILLLLPMCAQAAAPVSTQSLTLWICDKGEPTFKQNGDSLEIRCPGKPEPALTAKGCVGAKVKRFSNPPRFTLTCTSWVVYDTVKREPQP